MLTVIYNLIKNTRVTKILLLLTTVAVIVSYLLYTQVPYINLFIRKNFPEFSNFNADLSLYFSDLLTRLNNFYRSTLGFLNSTYQSIINTLASFINILYNIKNYITNVFNQARTNNNLPRDASLLISFRDTALINLKWAVVFLLTLAFLSAFIYAYIKYVIPAVAERFFINPSIKEDLPILIRFLLKKPIGIVLLPLTFVLLKMYSLYTLIIRLFFHATVGTYIWYKVKQTGCVPYNVRLSMRFMEINRIPETYFIFFSIVLPYTEVIDYHFKKHEVDDCIWVNKDEYLRNLLIKEYVYGVSDDFLFFFEIAVRFCIICSRKKRGMEIEYEFYKFLLGSFKRKIKYVAEVNKLNEKDIMIKLNKMYDKAVYK